MKTATVTIDENADGLGFDVIVDLDDGIPPAKVQLRGTIMVKALNKLLHIFRS